MEKDYSKLVVTNAHFAHDRLWLNWECPEVGFGQMVVEMNKNQLHFDTEMMGPTFTKAVMCALVDYGTII